MIAIKGRVHYISWTFEEENILSREPFPQTSLRNIDPTWEEPSDDQLSFVGERPADDLHQVAAQPLPGLGQGELGHHLGQRVVVLHLTGDLGGRSVKLRCLETISRKMY